MYVRLPRSSWCTRSASAGWRALTRLHRMLSAVAGEAFICWSMVGMGTPRTTRLEGGSSISTSCAVFSCLLLDAVVCGFCTADEAGIGDADRGQGARCRVSLLASLNMRMYDTGCLFTLYAHRCRDVGALEVQRYVPTTPKPQSGAFLWTGEKTQHQRCALNSKGHLR